MKKKQFLALALSAVMAGGMLAGCGNTASTTTDNGAADTTVTEAPALQRVMQKMKLLH